MNGDLKLKNESHLALYDICVLLMILMNVAFYDQTPIVITCQFIALIASFIFNPVIRVSAILKKYVVWWIAFITLCAISPVWSGIKPTYSQMMISICQCAVVGSILLLYGQIESRKNSLSVFLYISAVVLSVRLLVSTPIAAWGTTRVGHYIGYGNDGAGIILSGCAIVAIYRFMLNKRKRNLFFAILMFMLVIFTGSKKSFIFSLFGVGILFYFAAENHKKRTKAILITAIVVTVSWILIMNIPLLYNSIGYRMDALFNTLFGDRDFGTSSFSSSEERLLHYRYAWAFFKENPILGLGLDGYRFSCPIRQTYAHNNYLELLADFGVVGFSIYYGFFAYVVRKSAELLKVSTGKNRLRIAFLLSFTFFLLGMDVALVSYCTEKTHVMFAVVLSASGVFDLMEV